ncbi:phosphatidylglycerol--membrane-oligosaccharide glycerophosphotransferase [Enterobacterales bacterium CwR94]|nr:phosphatidylglycerol--membrane-oligosaccharide glycerophosphotransferase [Enterobacterales bacterium CwR94]
MSSEWLSLVLFGASIFIYATWAGRHKLWFSAILIVLAVFIILNGTLFASNYFTGDGINDAVLYTLTNSMTGAGVSKYILPGVGLIVGLTALFCALAWVLRVRKHVRYSRRFSALAMLLALGSINTTPAYQQVSKLIRSQLAEGSSDFADYYRVPAKTMKDSPPNLVWIYVESLERTYLNNDAFPDLAPELNQARSTAIDFSQTQQLPGTEYTIAGMVASQCGIPLFAPFDGNVSGSMSTFYPRSVCLGDILKANGYENHFVQGANLSFAGKDLFLKSHGFDHLYGLNELKTMVDDPDYRNEWGWYDDTVLDEVYQQYVALSKADKRFSLFTLTVDTHHPDGFLSRSCQRRSYEFEGKDNKSFSAVACSQEHVARLINRIKASPWFKNTVIVVSSDHLAMNNTAFKYLNQHERNNLFFVIRGDEPDVTTSDEKRSTLDNGATVLDIMGGDHAIGLGRSSLSETSLSSAMPELKARINAWKPDIIKLWNFPKSISDYQVDTQNNTFQFAKNSYKLPLLLKVTSEHVEPKFDGYITDPLKKQLSKFSLNDKFVWIDSCYKMGNVWRDDLKTDLGLCVANGNLGSTPVITKLPFGSSKGRVSFDKLLPSEATAFDATIAKLKVADTEISYPSDTFIFQLPGKPENVKSVSGLSMTEAWGRWSDARLAPAVTLTWQQPLPPTFELVLTAKALGDNVGKPVSVKVGNSEQWISLDHDETTVTLQFSNPEHADAVVITPPAPEDSTLGGIEGGPLRKLGVGLVKLQIHPINQ